MVEPFTFNVKGERVSFPVPDCECNPETIEKNGYHH